MKPSYITIGMTALALAACAPAAREAAREPAAPDTLTAAEHALAAEVADQAVARFRTAAPMYLVEMELIRPKEPEQPRRAQVTHYRYEGDLSIFTTVDLARGEVVGIDTAAHLPVPLAAAEVEAAERLARADRRVQAALARHPGDVRVEALLTRAASPEDPLFGNRVVRLLFRTERGYLEEPVVFVDLTERRVMIEDAQRR